MKRISRVFMFIALASPEMLIAPSKILRSICYMLFLLFSLPTTATALSFTRYDISSWDYWGLHSAPVSGYAIIQNEPVIRIDGDLTPNLFAEIYYDFIVTEFVIIFGSGLIHSGNGVITLADTYELTSEGPIEPHSAEDYWRLGDYGSGSGFGILMLGSSWESTNHDSLTTPILDLPDSLALNHYYYNDYYHETNDGRSCPSNGIILTNPAPVPEPATLLLLGTGLIGIAGFRKKFKK